MPMALTLVTGTVTLLLTGLSTFDNRLFFVDSQHDSSLSQLTEVTCGH